MADMLLVYPHHSCPLEGPCNVHRPVIPALVVNYCSHQILKELIGILLRICATVIGWFPLGTMFSWSTSSATHRNRDMESRGPLMFLLSEFYFYFLVHSNCNFGVHFKHDTCTFRGDC